MMRSCAAQKRMKMTFEKKFSNACFIPAPVRLNSNLSTLLKIWISFKKYQSIKQNRG